MRKREIEYQRERERHTEREKGGLVYVRAAKFLLKKS